MPALQEGIRHARMIDAIVNSSGRDTHIDPAVRDSWNRCLGSYSLDPTRLRKPVMVDRAELQTRREQMGSVYSIARLEMLGLCRQMLHSEFGIVLTDPDGVLLSYVGDPTFSDIARRSGFREGAVWSEREQGTNGMGTCLMEQRPLVIHQAEHFLVQNIDLTCSATPIFDLQGQLLAVLDISGRASAAQAHTLTLVNIAAQNIENRVLLDVCRQHYILRFHRRPEFVSTPGEGVIAYNQEGIVVGANRCALDLLNYPDHPALCGQPIDTVFDATAAKLAHFAARAAYQAQPLYAKRRRLRLFGVVQSPDNAIRKDGARSDGISLDSSEKTSTDPLDTIEFGDAVMAQNVHVARRVINHDISMLLLGETGTGKSHFAHAIHSAGQRAEKPFVGMNCASIPETLIESELFGYKAGAFTGANREGHSGRIIQASGGTLFLDEIGDMPLSLQVRLLSVIEDREVLPLGGSKPIPVDVRIISATHRNLVDRVAEGLFREDLYYRLNGISLTLPPLRERQDIAGIIRCLLRLEAGDNACIEMDEALLAALTRQPWPGNLRQIRNLLRTMLALRESDYLTLEDFPDQSLLGIPPNSLADEQPPPPDSANALGLAERDALLRILDSCRWNVSEAAERLQVSRKTLYRKIHRHEIKRTYQRGAHSARAHQSSDADPH